jgi:hypothetical protein
MDRVRFTRTRSLDLVEKILTEPGIYSLMTDDYSPPAAEFVANDHPDIWYVLVEDGPGLLGLFCFFPENRICWQGHVAFFRGLDPARTHRAGQEMPAWLWANTPCLRLEAAIPACHRAAVRFAERSVGVVRYAVKEKSVMKNGRLMDMVLLGMSKPAPPEVETRQA